MKLYLKIFIVLLVLVAIGTTFPAIYIRLEIQQFLMRLGSNADTITDTEIHAKVNDFFKELSMPNNIQDITVNRDNESIEITVNYTDSIGFNLGKNDLGLVELKQEVSNR